ncbi:MAG TPA: hypothetical protein VGR52_03850 [Stellaceae bacterium]|nr:hypothetical protein [Stellaceae bacterium]
MEQHFGMEGLSVMRFTLTYDGELGAKARHKQAWEIRRQLAPQLRELWEIDPSLQRLLLRRYLTSGGYFPIEQHHSVEQFKSSEKTANSIDLCEPIFRGGYNFVPLVRNSLLLKCGLTVIFLRKEPPGKVYQGGDLDNRLKTLFDALSVPTNPEQVVSGDTDAPDPICTLVEDDSLITGIDIETRQLLSRPGGNEHDVRLVIDVDVRVIQPRVYNQAFLGG